MQTRAAILWEPHTDWSIEDIELDDPKAGEVKIKLAASGLCHSDEHLVTGDMVLDPEIAKLMGWEQFPVIGGHEGAGEVVAVGPGVTTLQEGDHVVLSFIPACGRCPSCARGRQHLCDLGAVLLAGRQIGDMTARHHSKSGKDLGIMCCTGTFSPTPSSTRPPPSRSTTGSRSTRPRWSAAASPPVGARRSTRPASSPATPSW
ncbi:alcohol dehydrogenase catalytic domain-containing protein [Actinomadura madurae]|uniref:alcohol dehydrogenase catalytic domain-containing protein n=1 Tax=Actinomadura madurae TaxID=1993 RepID=UPI0020D2073A|nr:alcohol dehydrogenase catalytic domain-containing protein [Actinomadura madurae]MCP9982695.1 alcohol dehydrogenase catalytic domain-containing protein [Actinomadura madurae]MCQ0005755.1 alcohol dehydrogenase catalytic domain-containing protein [Actinomadura madurae]MCQ0018931.1 alcohol dehydrogenase catalytic domain-containing protein [Actinomadura madurae]